MTLNQKHIQQQIQKYSKALDASGENSPKALRWKDYLSAGNRYKELVKDIDISQKSILDVGCGFGDIIPYLNCSNHDYIYTGIDIMPKFIEVAQTRYAGFTFKAANFWASSFKSRYDYIICCGALNAKELSLKQRQLMIKKLFALSTVGTTFNMAGQHPKPKVKNKKWSIGYVDALQILKYCFSLTPKVILRHHYHPQDFTITLLH